MLLLFLMMLFIFHFGKKVACVAGVNREGEGEQERGRKIGDWGLGTRERPLQRS